MGSLVSIIMPVYNGERYLREAVDSVLGQSYPDWELIVVDDGSSDDTADIIRSYADTRIRYTFQENRGQAAALNHGLELALGVYVTTLDADDYLQPDSIAERAGYLDQHPADGAVYADGVYCNGHGKGLLRFTEHMPSGVYGDVYDILIVSPFYGTGATVLVRRAVLTSALIGYDEEIVWCQDWDFYIRLAEKTSFGFVPGVAIHYRLHDAGMTTSMPHGRRLESLIRLRKKVLSSHRFLQAALARKEAYFYDFLMKDLKGQPEEQEAVFNSPAFLAMPASARGRLMRLTANSYLLEQKETYRVGKWLRLAWAQFPRDAKTALAFGLFSLHPGLARRVVSAYQRQRSDTVGNDPFQLADVFVENGGK